MPEQTVETAAVAEVLCKRCGWRWTPRRSNPKWCPACNSPYWNKARERPTMPTARQRVRAED
ncbi:MAG: hypothetical protein ACRD1P_06960 [Thermoanaerobaculia bacterium]